MAIIDSEQDGECQIRKVTCQGYSEFLFYVFAIDFDSNPLPYILELHFPVGKRIFLISEDKDKK